MARVLVTGMFGTGKSTLLAALAARGRPTVDTDHDGWTLPDGTWDEPRITALLASSPDVVVSGTVENQGRFYPGRSPGFEHVVLLSAPLELLLQRVRTRARAATGNPYGSTPEQRAEIAGYLRDVEPLLRRGATVELDARRPVEDLAEEVAALE